MAPCRFDRIETRAEFEAAERELLRLAYEEKRTPLDAERLALTDALNDYRRRNGEDA
jgi:hypothetical protein